MQVQALGLPVLEIGAPAAGGAIVGALIGGKKGAAIGTAANQNDPVTKIEDAAFR